MHTVWLGRSSFFAKRASLGGHEVSTTVLPIAVCTSLGNRLYSQSTASQDGMGPRVAIIGSGPAGFYTARKLMREIHNTKLDMYEQLPVPFGLVRFGVAPDHPEVKNCQNEFDEVASSPNFNFIGNVQLGKNLPLPILSKHYDALVFAYGASKDRKIGLVGEDKPNIYSARAFVGWYNGLPEYRNLNPDLSVGETATIIGQGNVALDVARILLSSMDDLKKTDLTQYALEVLSNSKVKHVNVVGRRGPLQAAFTIKEARELIQLPGVNFEPIPEELFPADLKKLERPKKRLLELLKRGKPHDLDARRSWALRFLLSPEELKWEDTDSNLLTGISFGQNQLENAVDANSKVSPLIGAAPSALKTNILFRSIGYRAEAIPGMDLIGADFDERAGTLRHDGYGRIVPLDAAKHKPELAAAITDIPQQAQAAAVAKAHLYCAGWVKRGPTGVIASTMLDAFQTAEAIAQDWRNAMQADTPTIPTEQLGWSAVKADAEAEGYNLQKVVNWDGWHNIDAAEKELGAQHGKPREKLSSVSEMITAAGAA